MAITKTSVIAMGAAAVALLVGFSLAAYGFELVSVPEIVEFHEGLYVLAGVIIMAAGAIVAMFGIFRGKSG